MKKTFACAAMAAAMAMVPVSATGTKGNAKTQWGVGVRLGSVSGVTMQYKMDKFDVIAAGNFGLLNGGWVAGEGGVNFQIMQWNDWTPGEWAWTIGAVADAGFAFDDDKFYLGAFAPFRLNYTFPKAPWSFFVELGPGLEFLPDVNFDMEGGIGATYLF